MNPMASKLKTMRPRSARVRMSGDELQIEIFAPDVKGGDEEVVERRRCRWPAAAAWPASRRARR